MMIEGRACGKGLNIKGKSAKGGELSGFVPFLQIAEEEHKKLVGTSPADARIKVYFQTAEARAVSVAEVGRVLEETQALSKEAKAALAEEAAGERELSDAERAAHLAAALLATERPELTMIETHAPHSFGVDMPER